MRIKSCQPPIPGSFSRPRQPLSSRRKSPPRRGIDPAAIRPSDFGLGLPVTRRAGAAFYSTLSHQLSTSGAAARGLAPSPVEHLKASPTRTPQDSSDAWSRNGCTVVGVVVFILVSVPSPFTARFWCGGRDKWFPPDSAATHSATAANQSPAPRPPASPFPLPSPQSAPASAGSAHHPIRL